jgi:hypothetical protein
MGDEWMPVAERVLVVHPVRIDPSGLSGPTPGQARGDGYRRTSSGFYVASHVTDVVVEQRIVEAGRPLVTGALTGWAALRLWGGAYFDGLGRDGRHRRDVVVLAAADRLRSRDGVRVVRSRVTEDEVVVRYGVRCVVPERALFDEMRWAGSLEERVMAMDMAAAAELTSISRMASYAGEPRHCCGRGDVLWALRHADEHARSPQEVRLRLLWRRVCGPTSLRCNPTVLDEGGGFVGMPDLLEERTGVAGEFVGAVHRRRAQHRKDVARADRFRRTGLEPVEFVGADLDDDRLVADRIEAARDRARRHPRRWVVAPEHGPTLDDRLDLKESLRARYEPGGE